MTDARPTSVKVGYVDFTIRWLSDEEWRRECPGDQDNSGTTESTEARISIRVPKDGHPVHLRETLLHEIVHACFQVSGLSTENHRAMDDLEEAFVTRLTVVLIDVLRSNPDVTKFLLS